MANYGKNASQKAATKKSKNSREKLRKLGKTTIKQDSLTSACTRGATVPPYARVVMEDRHSTIASGTEPATTHLISGERSRITNHLSPRQTSVNPQCAQETVEQEVAPVASQSVDVPQIDTEFETNPIKVVLEVSGPNQKINLKLIYSHDCTTNTMQQEAAPQAGSAIMISASAASATTLEQSTEGVLESSLPISADPTHDSHSNTDDDDYLDVCYEVAICHLLGGERARTLFHMPQAPIQEAAEEPEDACDPIEEVTRPRRKVRVGRLFAGIAKAAASAAGQACRTSFHLGAAVPILAATAVLEVSASALSAVTPKRTPRGDSESQLTEGAALSSTAAPMEPAMESAVEPDLAPAMEVQTLAEDGGLQAQTFPFQPELFSEPDLFSASDLFQPGFNMSASNMWSNSMVAKNTRARATTVAAGKAAQTDIALSGDASECSGPSDTANFKISAYMPAPGEAPAPCLPTQDSAAEDGALEFAPTQDSQMLSLEPATDNETGNRTATLQPAPAATKTLAGWVIKAAGAAARLAITGIYFMIMSPVVIASVAIDLAAAVVKHTAAKLFS